MRVAIVGCGFVADLYLATLPNHPELELVGVADRVQAHAERFSAHYQAPAYGSVVELLADPRIEMVLNLTNPESHFAVSEACLLAGKHVYSEKPLAMSVPEAETLVKLAESRGLGLSGAPSRLLGETAQTMWRALRDGAVGKPLLAYAEMDDGLVHKMRYQKWLGASGAPWPYKNEFETGCTLEHAGYALTWLAAFFGPAKTVTAFASVQIPDKETDIPLEVEAPDLSVACIRYASGMVARLTCTIIAPTDHSIRIVGDEGVLSTDDCWIARERVCLQRRRKLAGRSLQLPWRSRVPMLGTAELRERSRGFKKVDFCLGPLELATSIQERRPCRLSARFCLHITEIALAIHGAMQGGSHCQAQIRSSFDRVDPMPWAR
jgi:predicted dehydrogenase